MPSNSVNNSEPEDLFRLIADGGKDFVSRVTAYTKAKEDHDKAYLALQLGRQTKNMLTEAQAAKDAAERALEDARVRADEIVKEAATKAAAAVKEGESRAAALAANAASAARNAEVAFAERDAKMRQQQIDTDNAYEKARRLADDNQRRSDELAASLAASKKAAQDADKVRVSYQQKHLALATFLAKQGA